MTDERLRALVRDATGASILELQDKIRRLREANERLVKAYGAASLVAHSEKVEEENAKLREQVKWWKDQNDQLWTDLRADKRELRHLRKAFRDLDEADR